MLVELMKKLLNGEVIVIEKKGDTVLREIFIEDNQFKENILAYPGSDDPYEQNIIGDGEALAFIDDWLIK